jgi:hypothetical protein
MGGDEDKEKHILFQWHWYIGVGLGGVDLGFICDFICFIFGREFLKLISTCIGQKTFPNHGLSIVTCENWMCLSSKATRTHISIQFKSHHIEEKR